MIQHEEKKKEEIEIVEPKLKLNTNLSLPEDLNLNIEKEEEADNIPNYPTNIDFHTKGKLAPPLGRWVSVGTEYRLTSVGPVGWGPVTDLKANGLISPEGKTSVIYSGIFYNLSDNPVKVKFDDFNEATIPPRTPGQFMEFAFEYSTSKDYYDDGEDDGEVEGDFGYYDPEFWDQS